ncbi:helix-turn-helix transcriptional regulator [Pseudokordiimonas caeni]|uniref:helix-turn-helix transcriptional regulator n=1 Tax=Pseudokordiimonas caeni TaxID=2997908 RepID=UPI0035942AD5
MNPSVTYTTHSNPNRLIGEKEAASYLGFSVRALQNWRVRGGGPKFVKISARAVRYRYSDLDAWTENRLVISTSEVANDR